MKQNIEGVIGGEKRPVFKSEGERRISYFLDINSIKYHYEPGILVNSVERKPRIWYPDFFLPELKIYIEYYGLAGNQNYNKGIKTKEFVYSKMGIDVIPVYPWMLAKNWKGYIMRELERTSKRRYKNLMAKPYWQNCKSYRNNHITSPRRAYRRSIHRHY